MMLLLMILFCSGIKGEEHLLASNGTRPLPIFIRPHGMMAHRFMENPIQAIITSYRFDCYGVVTEWRAFVEGSGGAHFKDQPYTISFQVWRPNSPSPVDTDGCYTMQGTNHFPSIPLADDRSADRGIVTGIPLESERIEVQPGDVVGFYLESSHMRDSNHDGIQFAPDSTYKSEAVWYVTGSYNKGPTDCPFPVGPKRVLSSSTNRAPLITATVSTTNCQRISIAVPSTTPPLQASTTTPTEPLPAYAVGLYVTIAATTVVILVFY
ncbi:uncharacterized protein LOC135351301 isoform X2 [Halichondria panicea]|uniref:uncharacterized protein LOC135351301 isoform X2 n=2 Tax=Halichondria panicea TaxID=6063 RepID=UPI00312B47A1